MTAEPTLPHPADRNLLVGDEPGLRSLCFIG